METPALKAAIELTLMPSRVRAMRDGPLPEGVPFLLRIAAGDEGAEREAVQASERNPKMIREAAAFFIEQMLLHPDADSYRVLGATSAASSTELRQNMALLMRWLHPDKNPREAQAVFVNRVNRAWDTLKTAERRRAYDLTLRSRPVSRGASSTGQSGKMSSGQFSGQFSGQVSGQSSGKSSGKPGGWPASVARTSHGASNGSGGLGGRRSQPPGYQRRALVLSDLLGHGDGARSGFVRRLLGYLFRPRR